MNKDLYLEAFGLKYNVDLHAAILIGGADHGKVQFAHGDSHSCTLSKSQDYWPNLARKLLTLMRHANCAYMLF